MLFHDICQSLCEESAEQEIKKMVVLLMNSDIIEIYHLLEFFADEQWFLPTSENITYGKDSRYLHQSEFFNMIEMLIMISGR